MECQGHRARTLTQEEVDSLNADSQLVSEYKQKKFEEEAKKHWDKFYMRNETRFFKDRHWTTREFEELLGRDSGGEKPVLLEIGCGVGNMVLPLIEDGLNFRFLACDFSPRAVGLLNANPVFSQADNRAFVCDMTSPTQLLDEVEPDSVDVATMIFMLSAVHPDKMSAVISNVFHILKPGGKILFRDYGLFDQAQLRFKRGHKLQDNFYVRQDGTRAYYFSEEKTKEIFEAAGFVCIQNEYVKRATINKKEGINVPRIFIQAKFAKPDS